MLMDLFFSKLFPSRIDFSLVFSTVFSCYLIYGPYIICSTYTLLASFGGYLLFFVLAKFLTFSIPRYSCWRLWFLMTEITASSFGWCYIDGCGLASYWGCSPATTDSSFFYSFFYCPTCLPQPYLNYEFFISQLPFPLLHEFKVRNPAEQELIEDFKNLETSNTLHSLLFDCLAEAKTETFFALPLQEWESCDKDLPFLLADRLFSLLSSLFLAEPSILSSACTWVDLGEKYSWLMARQRRSILLRPFSTGSFISPMCQSKPETFPPLVWPREVGSALAMLLRMARALQTHLVVISWKAASHWDWMEASTSEKVLLNEGQSELEADA